MRLAVLMTCVLASAAMAGPPPRKPASDGYSLDALEAFAKAVVLERLGDVAGAIKMYALSERNSSQPNTQFNLARLYLELEDREKAVKAFEKYLELAPAAPDRAAITKLMTQLRAEKPLLTIGGTTDRDPADAVILVDGAPVGRAPASLRVSPGKHFVERITTHGYGSDIVDVVAGTDRYINVYHQQQRRPGNVVITLGQPDRQFGEWSQGTHRFAIDRLFTLPAGTYKTRLRDDQLCTPVTFDVASSGAITYVHIVLAKRDDGATCDTVQKVRSHKVDPRAP